MDEEEEIILSLTNENKNLKNDYSCLLGQHVGVMLEKNEVVKENKCLKEKLNAIKCQLEEKVVENKKIKGDLKAAKFVNITSI